MIEYQVLSFSDVLESFEKTAIQNALQDFQCSQETDLVTFLVEKAENYENNGNGRTYLVVEDTPLKSRGELRIIAYYTLALTAVDLSRMGENKKKKVVGNYPNRSATSIFPAFLIGQFGRSDRYTSEQLSGQQLMYEAYHSLKTAFKSIGGKLVLLECREHMYDKVYCHLGYHKLDDKLNEHGLYMLYNKLDLSKY